MKIIKNKFFWMAIGLLVVGVLAFFFFPHKAVGVPLRTVTIQLNGKPLTLEIAQTTAEVQQGLSDRASMPLDHGMIFLMGAPDYYSFWMYHMHFPLDLVWLRNGVVVDSVSLPAPKTFELPRTYKSGESADMIIEMNKGQAATYGLNIGSTVDIHLP